MGPLTKAQIQELLRSLAFTRDREIACDECHRELAEFAEITLEGKTIPEGLRAVEHHLTLCGECREEYEDLVEALRTLNERPS